MKLDKSEIKFSVIVYLYFLLLLVGGLFLSIVFSCFLINVLETFNINVNSNIFVPFFAAYFGAIFAFILNGISVRSHKKYYYISLKTGLLHELKIARDRMTPKGLPGLSFEVFKTCSSDPIFLQKIKKDIPNFLERTWVIMSELRYTKTYGGQTTWSIAVKEFRKSDHYKELCELCELLEKSIDNK